MSAARDTALSARKFAGTRPEIGPILSAACVIVALVLVAAVSTLGNQSSSYAPAIQIPLAEHVGPLTYLNGPDAAELKRPADVAVAAGHRFVVGTGGDRILAIDEGGFVTGVIDPSDGAEQVLKRPMAIATDGRLVYVANTGAGNVVAMTASGSVVRVIDLPPLSTHGQVTRLVGIAVDPAGGIAVSDAGGNRVLRFDAGWNLRQVLGSGTRGAGTTGFNAPGGLAFDASGYLYVVDMLNGRVVRLAPDGGFAGEFGRPGDTGGTLSRPKDVAVDRTGKVYVTDMILAAVQVFDADGRYLGFIGRADPGAEDSRSLFTAPSGLAIAGDSLMVVDRFEGLFDFDLEPQ